MSVPDKFHISWLNDIADFALSSDVAPESAYPLTNMQNNKTGKSTVFDMTSDSSVAITGSDSAQRSATCFAIHSHNMPDDATVRIRLYADAGQAGTLLHDSGALSVAYTIPWISAPTGFPTETGFYKAGQNTKSNFSTWFETVVYRSFQIDISLPTAINNELIIDKAWLGYAFAPEHGLEYGYECVSIDNSVHIKKRDGFETVEYEALRRMNLDFEGVSDDQRQIIRYVLEEAKKGGDLLVTIDPNNAKGKKLEGSSIYKRVSNAGFIASRYNWNQFALSLEEN